MFKSTHPLLVLSNMIFDDPLYMPYGLNAGCLVQSKIQEIGGSILKSIQFSDALLSTIKMIPLHG